MRFEPNFKPSQLAIDNCIKAHKPAYMNRSTAEMICKTSWGTYQIMGENVFTICKHQFSIAEFLKFPDVQEMAYHAHNRAKGIDFTLAEVKGDVDKRNLFARRYNGSVKYAATLMAAI